MKELKKKCCEKYKKKGKSPCKRCPLREASMPSIDRHEIRKELDEKSRDKSA